MVPKELMVVLIVEMGLQMALMVVMEVLVVIMVNLAILGVLHHPQEQEIQVVEVNQDMQLQEHMVYQGSLLVVLLVFSPHQFMDLLIPQMLLLVLLELNKFGSSLALVPHLCPLLSHKV